MLNCKTVTELCSQELERELAIGERVGVQAHLMMCSGCSNFRKQMKMLRRVTHAYVNGQAQPPDSLDPSSNGGVES
jgi:predicted anti-sigma-YlaC factor YlaD